MFAVSCIFMCVLVAQHRGCACCACKVLVMMVVRAGALKVKGELLVP